MSDSIINSVRDCLLSLLHSCTTYEKLAEKAQDESVKKLLISFANEERLHLDALLSHYTKISGTHSPSVTLPHITIYDFYTSLLECITFKIADIDNYKVLCTKIQAGELRNLLLLILKSKVRQGFGLLVLITPEELHLES